MTKDSSAQSLWRRENLNQHPIDEKKNLNQELSPDSTISHYRIVSKLSAGGMGAVYRAYDSRRSLYVFNRQPVQTQIDQLDVASDRRSPWKRKNLPVPTENIVVSDLP